MHYLDNAATTAVAPEVTEVIYETMKNCFGNPSSLYKIGMHAEQTVEDARKKIAGTLGCKAEEFYFTSCGTESNNIAIQGAIATRQAWGKSIVCTGFEHPAVYKQIERFEKQGYKVTFVTPNKNGEIDEQAIINAIQADTCLATFMHVNNEIGTMLNAQEIAKKVKEKNGRTAIHVDGVQAWGKLSINLNKTVIDSYSITGHKVHAPKGIGGLYLRKGFNIEPPFLGGGQEKGIRPGTENIPYIVGLAKAAELFDGKQLENYEHVKSLETLLKDGLRKFDNIIINSPNNALPYVVNFSVMGMRSEVLLHFLEEQRIYVSSGSACSKGAASHTLVAMKLDNKRIDGAVRVSFNAHNTAEDVQALLQGLKDADEKLIKMN